MTLLNVNRKKEVLQKANCAMHCIELAFRRCYTILCCRCIDINTDKPGYGHNNNYIHSLKIDYIKHVSAKECRTKNLSKIT